MIKSKAEIINELWEEIKNLRNMISIKDTLIDNQQKTIKGWKTIVHDMSENEKKKADKIKQLQNRISNSLSDLLSDSMLYRTLSSQLNKEIKEIKESIKPENRSN